MMNNVLERALKMAMNGFNFGNTSIVKLAIVFFKLIGLFPCIVQKSPELWFSPSKLWIIHHTILCGILTYTNYYLGVPEIGKKYADGDKSVRMVIEMAQLITATSITITIWILYVFKEKEIISIANGFLKCDLMLKNFYLGCQLENSALHCIIFIPIYLIFWSILIWTELLLSPNLNPWYIELCIYIIPSFTITSFILQYTVAVDLVQKRLKALNKLMLKHILDVEDVINPMIMHTCIVMKDFDNWKSIHDELHALMTMIAKFFSLLILFVLGYICFTIIFCSFYVITNLNGSDLELRLLLVTNGIIWIGMLFVLPAILVFQIQSLTTEMNRKGLICHKLLAQYKMHQKFKRQVVATTVTYLVIILQFQGSTDESTNG